MGRGALLLLGSYMTLGGCAGRAERTADTAAGTAANDAAAAADTAHAMPQAARTTPHRRSILFIGTSLTAGLGLDPDSAYPQLIQLAIDSAGLPFEVTNAGVSGETTAGLLQRLDWLMRGSFDVVIVESGANDGLRGTAVASVERNLRQIIQRIQQAHPQARVLLVQMEAPPNLGPAYTRAFHAMYPTVAREAGVTLVPFLLTDVAGVPSLNQGDGIHPNQRGEHIVASNVWRVLEPVLDSLPESTPGRAAAADSARGSRAPAG